MKLVTVKKRTAVSSLICFCILMISAGIFFENPIPAGLSEAGRVPVRRVERDDGKIALTFFVTESGEQLSDLADTLHKSGVNASFFVSCRQLEANRDALSSLCSQGHELLNGTDTLFSDRERSSEAFREELLLCDGKISEITGKVPELCRFSYGNYTREMLTMVQDAGKLCVGWDLDSFDWKNLSPDALCERVVSNAQSGSIILFHTDQKNTLKAMPQLLSSLKKKGLTPVMLSELLYDKTASVTRDGIQKPPQ